MRAGESSLDRHKGRLDNEKSGGGVGSGGACSSQCVETSVEVLWFHQPRLRSVRPGAPSHILWYVLLPPPNPSSLPNI